MEQLHNGYTLVLSKGAFPLSTDSIALSGFVKPGKNARVLDLGSGCGTLGVLLCAKDPVCHVTGIELDPEAHETALRNIAANALTDRLTSICVDLRTIPSLFKSGSFDICISNPPYFTAGPKSKTVPLARREDTCSLDQLLSSAAWALKYGGDCYLVHRPERLGEICAVASKYKLEAKRLCLLRHRMNDPVSLILVQLRKGGKPGLIWEEECLHNPDGSPTDYYRRLYHL